MKEQSHEEQLSLPLEMWPGKPIPPQHQERQRYAETEDSYPEEE